MGPEWTRACGDFAAGVFAAGRGWPEASQVCCDSTFCAPLLARLSGGVSSPIAIIEYGSNDVKKIFYTKFIFSWNLENMMIIPWSLYESCKTCYSFHHHAMNHGKNVTKYDRQAMSFLPPRNMPVVMVWSWPCFGMIMIWSWQDDGMAAMFCQAGKRSIISEGLNFNLRQASSSIFSLKVS